MAVADAGPLRYLVLTEKSHLLSHLFDRVFVPSVVVSELTHRNTPEPVARWMKTPPAWLETTSVVSLPAGLDHLDEGERQAIALAEHLRIQLLLMDEADGRAAAASRGLAALGTIGILERAANLGLVDFASAFHDLQQTNFHMSAAFLKVVKQRHKLR